MKLFSCLLIMLFMLRPVTAQSQPEISVKAASTQLDESVFFLNAVFEIKLPEYMASAFEKGFELPFLLEVEVFRERNLWFDKDVVYIKQQYRLQYHSILDRVSLMNINAGSHHYFDSLDDALSHLMVMLNYPLLDNNALNNQETYRARLRMGIDTEELPVPLKSSSFWDNNWNISSDWYEWGVTP